jgi:hypothetical protein
MKKYLPTLLLCILLIPAFGADGCDETTDDKQQAAQEKILAEANAQTGMPAIKNFRERKLLKDILEMRDQDGLVTYTYLFAEQTGKLIYLGESIGYGIPYATQYTNPEKVEISTGGRSVIPQADPNGLFSPASCEGTWVLLKGPNGKVQPTYIEPRIIVSPFKLNVQ